MNKFQSLIHSSAKKPNNFSICIDQVSEERFTVEFFEDNSYTKTYFKNWYQNICDDLNLAPNISCTGMDSSLDRLNVLQGNQDLAKNNEFWFQDQDQEIYDKVKNENLIQVWDPQNLSIKNSQENLFKFSQNIDSQNNAFITKTETKIFTEVKSLETQISDYHEQFGGFYFQNTLEICKAKNSKNQIIDQSSQQRFNHNDNLNFCGGKGQRKSSIFNGKGKTFGSFIVKAISESRLYSAFGSAFRNKKQFRWAFDRLQKSKRASDACNQLRKIQATVDNIDFYKKMAELIYQLDKSEWKQSKRDRFAYAIITLEKLDHKIKGQQALIRLGKEQRVRYQQLRREC